MAVLLSAFIPLKKVESHIMSHKMNETLDQRVHQVALASIPNGKYWIGIGQAEEGSGIIGHSIHLNLGWSGREIIPLIGYEWSDGSAANYFNWNQNIELEAEMSCTIVEESGHWHHSLCNQTIGFVCQVPRPQKNCLQGHGHLRSFSRIYQIEVEKIRARTFSTS